jgi:PAS domain S-box-containing protein
MVAGQGKNSTETQLKNLQQELADSQARFRNVIERNADGILIVGAEDGIVRYLNSAAEELFGVSAEELEGEMFGFPVVAGRKSSIDIVRRDRSDVVAEMHVVDTEWEGEPALLASLRDITPRVRALNALKVSEQRYRILFEHAGDAIFVVSFQGNFLDVNQIACRRYGYSLDELLDMTPKELNAPERADQVDQVIEGIIQKGSDIFETVHRRADGSTIPVEINAQVIEHINQKAILCVVRDITERKQAEQALRESEAKFRNLFETMGHGVVYHHKDGQIVSANPAAARILGLTVDQILGRTSMDPRWHAIHEDGSEFPGEAHPSMVALREGEEIKNVIMGVYNPRDDQYRWIKIHAVPQFHPGEEEPYQVYTTFEDITRLKRAEQKLTERIKELTCLYAVGRSMHADLPVDQLCQEIVEHLIPAMRYSQSAVPVIALNGDRYTTAQYREGLSHGIHAPISVRGASYGDLSVYYLDDKPFLLPDEQNLINNIADALGEWLERKEIEEKITSQKERLSNIIEGTNVGTWEWNVQTGEVIFNQKWAQIIGYTLEELEPISIETWMKYTHPDDLEKSKALLEKHFRGESDYYQCELRMRHKQGHWVWILDRGKVIEWSQDGRPLRMFGMHQDVTERKQAERALKWQQEIDAAMADLSKDLLESIPIEDISYRVLEHAKRLTGSTFGYVGYIDPESGYLVCPTMTRDIWEQCRVPDKDIVFKEYGGLWGWVLENRQSLMTNAPGEDPRSSGVPPGHVPIERFLSAPAMIGDELVGQIALANPESDYSERDLRLTQRLASIYALALQRKRAEDALADYSHHLEEMVTKRTEALRQAQEKALRQERLAALGQLAGGVAHDLRNPLSVISSAVYYLKMVQSDAEDIVVEYLDMIDDEIRTADRIVTDLLDFARDKTVVPRAVDLDEVVAHVLDRMPSPQGISLAIQIPEHLPQVHVDSGHLKQILTNLITNAYQAMPEGGILSLRASTVDRRVQLDVSDTGKGIPPENMDKIFAPLFTTKSRGIGLGLAICQKLIEANQGDISVTSEEGEGSTFTITLPIYQEEKDAQEQSHDD